MRTRDQPPQRLPEHCDHSVSFARSPPATTALLTLHPQRVHPPLSNVEVRILGALVEKSLTTPDTYPLSLAALLAACNQATNRDPVMQLDEATVNEAIVALRRRSLLRAIQPAGSRVTKYQHLLGDSLELDAREVAVLAVLMLRGPQTPGELHARTGRLADFADRTAVEATLDALAARTPDALVVRLPRRAGQKESRYAHLLAGEFDLTAETEAPLEATSPPSRSVEALARVATLEQALDELRTEIGELRAQFDAFREQFR